MRMTKSQRDEIKCCEWFIPRNMKERNKYTFDCGAIEDKEGEDYRKVFLEYTERGAPIEKRKVNNVFALEKLLQGRRWRGIHIHEMWKEGIESGEFSIKEITEDMLEFVKKRVLKELNKILWR